MTEQPKQSTRPPMLVLYHYTCDHARRRIGRHGTLIPAATQKPDSILPWPSLYVWATDLARPDRAMLGLTSHLISCDRTAHRYRLLDPSGLVRWTTLADRHPADQVAALQDGCDPAHWWVSTDPADAVLRMPNRRRP